MRRYRIYNANVRRFGVTTRPYPNAATILLVAGACRGTTHIRTLTLGLWDIGAPSTPTGLQQCGETVEIIWDAPWIHYRSAGVKWDCQRPFGCVKGATFLCQGKKRFVVNIPMGLQARRYLEGNYTSPTAQPYVARQQRDQYVQLRAETLIAANYWA